MEEKTAESRNVSSKDVKIDQTKVFSCTNSFSLHLFFFLLIRNLEYLLYAKYYSKW